MFGPKIKAKVVEAIDVLLTNKMTVIDEVHENDGEISLAIKVKLGELGKKGLNWSAELSFVKEKVKVGVSGQTDEKQMEIAFGESVLNPNGIRRTTVELAE
jgi:hypothetical protein